MRVNVYVHVGSPRGELIANSILAGISRCGERVRLVHVKEYKEPDADVAVFYGLHRGILDGYRNAGKKAVYVDLGYWGRHDGGRRSGYHKFAINSRHPTAYFQKRAHSNDRFSRFGIEIQPWKNGRYIIVGGMSAKAAKAEGLAPEAWERKIIPMLRDHTDREIIYRPKPNWKDASSIPWSRMVRGDDGDIHRYLDDCHAMVTHHSNVAVDALLYGVPSFCWDGVAVSLSSQDIAGIEAPPRPDGREQWAYDLAHTQWNVAEMVDGSAWRYLREELVS